MDETGGNLSFALSYNVGRGGRKMCASLPSFFLDPPPYTGLAAGDQTERARLNKFALIFSDHHQAGPFPLSPPHAPSFAKQ